MEDILAVVLLLGGFAAFMLSISPVGRAIADRIRSGDRGLKEEIAAIRETQVMILEELDQLRSELTEVQERFDFAERLLTDRGVSKLPQDREEAS